MDSNVANSNPAKPQSFTDMMRVWANPIMDPIVTVLGRLGFSPNTLTVIGMLGHFALAWFVSQGQFLYAAITMMVIAPFDALDGALARKINFQQGGFGAFLDSTLDRVAEIIFFGGFIYYFQQTGDTTMVLVAYLAITGSLMVSYSRGRAEGLGFDGKVGLFGRLERYLLIYVMLLFSQPSWLLIILAIFTYITVAQRMLHVWRQARNKMNNPTGDQ